MTNRATHQFFISPDGRKVVIPPGWRPIFDSLLQARGYQEANFTNINKEGDKSRCLIERNTGGLGDILMIMPAIKTLVEEFSGRVTVSVPGQYSWMFRDMDIEFVDCFVFAQNYIENRKPFYYHFDLQCPYIQYKADNEWQPKKNRVEVFAETLGVTPKKPKLSINEKFFDKRFIDNNNVKVGLILEVADRTRPWPLDRWIELSYKLQQQGFQPVTFTKDKIIKGIDAVHGLSMERLVTVMSQMDIVVTADTGPLHIAAALDKKFIGLFGATNGALICKMYPSARVIHHLTGPTPCTRPCYGNIEFNNYCCGDHKYSSCMIEITTDEVMDAIIKESVRTDN